MIRPPGGRSTISQYTQRITSSSSAEVVMNLASWRESIPISSLLSPVAVGVVSDPTLGPALVEQVRRGWLAPGFDGDYS
jgi:hypothetical protein